MSPKLGFTEQRRELTPKNIQDRKPLKSWFRAIPFKSQGVVVLLFFSGAIGIGFISGKTIISEIEIVYLIVICAAASISWQHFYGRTLLDLKKGENMAVAVFGMTPMLSALLLFLNYKISIETYKSEHRVVDVNETPLTVRFDAEGIPCSQIRDLCNTYDPGLRGIHRGDTLVMEMGLGIFGYMVFKDIYPKSDY